MVETSHALSLLDDPEDSMWTAMAKTRDSLESAGAEELVQASESEFVDVADVGATQHPRVPRPSSSKRPAHGSGPKATGMPSGLPPWRGAERFLDKYAQESSVQHCEDTDESCLLYTSPSPRD